MIVPFANTVRPINLTCATSILIISIKPELFKGDYGDVSSRKKLRTDLQCKSFRWYLENVFQELEIPSDNVASGEVKEIFRKYFNL